MLEEPIKPVIHTPGGLKIRVDPDRVERVLAPVRDQIDLRDAYHDVELWAGFPNAFSSVCTILAAAVTHSIIWTAVVFLLTFGIANAFQQFTYSRILNIVFPTFLGGWIVALPASVVTGVYLFLSGATVLGLLQFVIVVANLLHYTDTMLFLFMPIRLSIRKARATKLGDIEVAFIRILSLQARRAGIELDWNEYNERGI